MLLAQVTEAAVARALCAPSTHAQSSATCLPWLHAMNFVLDEVLDGGVNDALNLDTHGKALSFLAAGFADRGSRFAGGLVGRACVH